MAKYYNIDHTDIGISIKEKLLSYYGNENVAIHSNTKTEIIFSCPQIAGNKVLKIQLVNESSTQYLHYQLILRVGDNESMSNMMTILSGISDYNSTTYCKNLHLVLGDTFIYCAMESTNASYSNHFIVGRLTNGDYVAIGGYYNLSTNSMGYLFSKSKKDILRIICPTVLSYSNGMVVASLAYLVNNNDAIMNDDGTLASIDGINVIGGITSNFTVGTDYVISFGHMYGYSSYGDYMNARIFIEIER